MTGWKAEDVLTGIRLAAGPVIAILLITTEQRFALFWLYLIVSLTDILDGILARRKSETRGDIFDPVADKILFLCTLVALVYLGDANPILSLIILTREIWVLGLRAEAERRGFSMESSKLGKIKTFMENVSACTLILKEKYFGISAHLVGTITLAIATALSAITGVEYTMRWKEKARI